MTADQFDALAKLLRVRNGKSRIAASLVLVDGLTQAAAARQTDLSTAGVGNVIASFRRGLELVGKVAG